MSHSSLFFAGVLGLGGPEVIIILVIFMLLFGAKKLPDLAQGLGKSIKEFKRASQEDEPDVRSNVGSSHAEEPSPAQLPPAESPRPSAVTLEAALANHEVPPAVTAGGASVPPPKSPPS